MPCLDSGCANFASLWSYYSPLRWPDPTWRKFPECSWVSRLIKRWTTYLPTKVTDIHCNPYKYGTNDSNARCPKWSHHHFHHCRHCRHRQNLEVGTGPKTYKAPNPLVGIWRWSRIFYAFWVLYISKCSTWYLLAGDVEKRWLGRYLGSLTPLWGNCRPEHWAASKCRVCIAW